MGTDRSERARKHSKRPRQQRKRVEGSQSEWSRRTIRPYATPCGAWIAFARLPSPTRRWSRYSSKPPSGGCRAYDRLRRSFGDEVRGAARFLPGTLQGLVSGLLGLCARLAFRADLVELVVCQMLDPNERVVHGAHSDELVQLHLDGGAVAILRV